MSRRLFCVTEKMTNELALALSEFEQSTPPQQLFERSSRYDRREQASLQGEVGFRAAMNEFSAKAS